MMANDLPGRPARVLHGRKPPGKHQTNVANYRYKVSANHRLLQSDNLDRQKETLWHLESHKCHSVHFEFRPVEKNPGPVREEKPEYSLLQRFARVTYWSRKERTIGRR